jgi:hypothetical protein
MAGFLVDDEASGSITSIHIHDTHVQKIQFILSNGYRLAGPREAPLAFFITMLDDVY